MQLNGLGDRSLQHTYALQLLMKVTGITREELVIARTIMLTPAQEALLKSYIHDLTIKNKPLAYILDTVPFLDLTITVKPPILIPRPETEWWTELARQEVIALAKDASTDQPFKILDLCTGSGCIALALALISKSIEVTAIDINPQALALARLNAHSNSVKNVTFIHSDLFTALDKGQSYDMIVTNPPYVSTQEYAELPPEVSLWEDRVALLADNQGLSIIEAIITSAPLYLRQYYGCGQLWCEIGAYQGAAVSSLFSQNNFTYDLLVDQSGKNRLIKGFLVQ